MNFGVGLGVFLLFFLTNSFPFVPVIPITFKLFELLEKEANEKHNNGLQKYRAAEGKTVTIPYRGTVVDTMDDILGGLRSACTYVGANKIKDLSKCATFIKVNNQYNAVFGKS